MMIIRVCANVRRQENENCCVIKRKTIIETINLNALKYRVQ